MTNEYSQPDAPEGESLDKPLKRRHGERGTRGNRKAQAARYYARNRSKLLERANQRHAANRRPLKNDTLDESDA